MSFGLDVKKELCKASLDSPCCARGEALGVLLYCNTFSPQQIRIVTSSSAFARRLPELFQKAFQVDFDLLPNSSGKHSFTIENPDKLAKILDLLDYARDFVSCHIQFGLLEESCCRLAFCRGAFLAGGTITNPTKSYHLELLTSHSAVNRELPALLHECDYHPKLSTRKGHFLAYFKQSIHIQDFLQAISAPASAVVVADAIQQKSLTSSVNRQVNCDAANVNKAVDAALSQIQAIRTLESQGFLADLPEKLQETATMRLENPYCTLSELAEFFSPPLTKSALNHRLRKLMTLANTISLSEE